MDPAMAIYAAAIERQKPLIDATAQGDSDVQRFYKDSVIFLTGGSGFLGKQLLVKLLSSCQISKVYMLIRVKKGKEVSDRFHEIIQDPIFQNIANILNMSKKIKAIEGDTEKIRLGINDKDWGILTKEVQVIFHAAATTRFDETLQKAALINIRGTREALLLGKLCKNLRSFVHVSTAYSHITTQMLGMEVREEFYDVPMCPKVLISMAEDMDPERLKNITKELIRNWPNTYTFTKAMTEELIRTTSDGLPVCVVRPAIVLSTYREPIPGWIDNSCIYGAAGIVLGSSIGATHALLINLKVKLAFIPCDYVNNAVIVAAKNIAQIQSRGGNDTKIYTVCSTHRNPITFRKIYKDVMQNGRNFGSPKTIYYPFLIYTHNKVWFDFIFLFIHIIPAYAADSICGLLRIPKRFVKLTKKLKRTIFSMAWVSLNDWNFVDDNLENLFSSMSPQDKTIFNFDVTDIDWTEYLLYIFIGLRKYVLKDGLRNTESGIRRQKYLKYVNYTILLLYSYCIWIVLYYVVCMCKSCFLCIKY